MDVVEFLDPLEPLPDTARLLAVQPVPESAGALGRDVLERALEAMPAAFAFLDHDWRLEYVNALAQELMGRPPEELMGRSLWEIYPDLAGTSFESAYREAAATGQAVIFEAQYTGSGGPNGWFEVRAWPGPDGMALYWVDVSDRHRVEEASQRAAARLALLAEVNAELSGALDSESALGRLARLVVPTLTDGCIVTVVDRYGHARDVGSWHADPGRQELMAQYAKVRLETLPGDSPVARALAAGTAVTESIDAVLALMRPGPARDLLISLGAASAVVLPLRSDSRTVGVLTMYLDPGRVPTDEDMEAALEVAGQAARAIARVHRHSQETKLAEELQRSLLTAPPPIPHVAVAVRYVPAAESAQVGGDWYDAFLQRSGEPVLVIGDVVGHDTAAAATMGQLRSLLRGLAHHSDAGPVEVLRGLDEAMAAMHAGTMATAAVARVEGLGGPDGPLLRWANAGHPPPAVLFPDGTVTLLGGMMGDLMLGVDETAERTERVLALPPGALVLLYTDGLIERRASSLDAGFEQLRTSLADLAGRSPDEVCDEILARLLPGTPQDDVALIAVRLIPPM